MPTIREDAAIAARDISTGLYTTRDVIKIVKKPIHLFAKKFQSIETLSKNANKLSEKLEKLGKLSDGLKSYGVTRPFAKVVDKVIDGTEKKIKKASDEIETISEASNALRLKVEKVDKALKDASKVLKVLSIAANQYSKKLHTSDENLKSAESLIDFGILPDSLDKGAFLRRLEKAQEDGDSKSAVIEAQLSEIGEDITKIADKISEINERFTNSGIFDKFSKLDGALRAILNLIEPVFGPLISVVKKIEPVLDALGSIFGFLLKPLEWALDFVISSLGIDKLLDALAEEVLSLLPDFDIFDGIAKQLKDLVQEFEDFVQDEIINPFTIDVQGKLEDLSFPNAGAVGTAGDDILSGAFFSTAELTLEGFAGNDALYGADFDDTLLGGDGADILMGGGGNDWLYGGDNPVLLDALGEVVMNSNDKPVATEPDIVIYSGSINDYAIIAAVDTNGDATGRWLVSDTRTDAELAGSSRGTSDGTDQLFNIETIFFSDTFLDLTKFSTFVNTRSQDGEVITVIVGSSDITPIEDPANPGTFISGVTSNQADAVLGGVGVDLISSGPGNDQLTSVSNGELSRTISVGDIFRGDSGNDTYILGVDSAAYDFIEDTSGIDTVVYSASNRGLTVFLGTTDDELFFKPSDIFIDADSIGRSVNTAFLFSGINAGVVRGIENIDGSEFADIFYGTNEDNVIKGAGGDDQIRGLAGNDVILGGAGDDTLIGDKGDDYIDGGADANTYIGGLGFDEFNDSAGSRGTVKYSTYAETSHYNMSVQFVQFTTTGFGTYDEFDMPGAIAIVDTDIRGEQVVVKFESSVDFDDIPQLIEDGEFIGIDILTDIERIVGTVGDDLIYTSPDIGQTIYTNDGNDFVVTADENNANRIYAGPGDDRFISGSQATDTFFGGAGSDTVYVEDDEFIDGDLYFGDDNRVGMLEGIDVLDLSSSVYSWYVYHRPGGGNGDLVGKYALSVGDVDDPLFIQPTLGINGVVEKQPGVSNPDEEYPGVPDDLIKDDPNTVTPGGRANSFSEFEHIIGSEQRDIIVGGNPEQGMRMDGMGGDDALYAAQEFAAELYGGMGNDVLGTYNHTLGDDTEFDFFDVDKRTTLDGGMGDDTFVAGDFQEEITGGEGRDWLTYEVSTAGVSVNLAANLLSGGYATGDILTGGIENVVGSQFDDILEGDDLTNELIGWDGDDILRGYDGADILYGNDGNDLLYGGDGGDLLHGGNGLDLLNGGAGIDTASWTLHQYHPKGGLETLTGDITGVTANLLTGMSSSDILVSIENLKGSEGDDHFTGSNDANLLAGNHGHDTLDGAGGDDVLVGGLGNDSLIGGAGDDFLNGGAGVNTLEGGDGSDTIDYGSLTSGVQVTMAGVGARAGLLTGTAFFKTPVDFFVWKDSLLEDRDDDTTEEELIAAATNEIRYTYQTFDRGTDDPSDDITVQEDEITPERIWYLDPEHARNAADIVDVRFLPDDGLLPEQQVAVLQQLIDAEDLFSSIERIAGSQGDDSILGNDEDTFFYGGLGADTIDGGAGVDIASYEKAEEGVDVRLGDMTFAGGEAEGDVLTGIENLVGTHFADRLDGNGDDNRIVLGTGNDTSYGGDGTDTVVFEFASDGVFFLNAQEGIRVVTAEGDVTTSVDLVGDDVEFFEFTDTTLSRSDVLDQVIVGTVNDDLLIGTVFADFLEGLGGNDVIEGRDSNDTLDGGSGNDILRGEAGNDLLIGGSGSNRLEGGSGDDTYRITSATDTIVEATDAGLDTVEVVMDFVAPQNIEVITVTSEGNFTITGNTSDNLITGSAGDEVLVALDGADTLDGGTGLNTLIGGDGADRYIINQQGDTIVEADDAGYDTIITTVDMDSPDNVEEIVVFGGNSLTITGNDQNNTFVDGASVVGAIDVPMDGMGSSTFDGGGGTNDIMIFSYDFASSTIGYDSAGFLTITNGEQTDRIRNIEKIDFADQFFTYEDLLLEAFPPQDVQVNAGDYYTGTTAIDMTPEGGGTQFIFAGDTDTGNNENDEYNYAVSFGGKAEFRGQNLQAQDEADGTVNSISVDFNGGNTTRLSVDGFTKTLEEMKNADWAFWQSAIFGGDDRITGSYHDDKLVGYAGDDIILGGLGDKVGYDYDNQPGNRPSDLRDPGAVVSNPDFFVDDGNDVIEGLAGNDSLDGGTGRDIVLGGEGDDVIFGGGGDYADSLFGGEGDDTLKGGEGGDTFVLALGMGREVITDFEVGVDTIDFSSLSQAEFDQINIVSSIPGVTLIQLFDGSQMELLGVSLTELPLPVLTAGSLNGTNGTRIDLGVEVTNLSGAGDLNGDGIDDFIVGWAGEDFIGPVGYVVYGREGGFGATTQPFMMGLDEGFSLVSATPVADGFAQFPEYAVSQAGDFNGDGIDDLLVSDKDTSHIIFGKLGGITENFDLGSPLPTGTGIMFDFGLGFGNVDDENITGGIDLNNDGFDDVIVADASDFGTVRVIYGTDAALTMITEAELDGTKGVIMTSSDHDFSYTGNSVSSAGDMNGDGIEDLFIGAPFKEVVNQNDMTQTEWTGGGYVVYGSASGFAPLVDLGTLTESEGTEVFGNYDTVQGRTGFTVTGGGDVNRDGVDDIGLSRVFLYDRESPGNHAAYIVYGQMGGLGADFQMSNIDGMDGSKGTVFTFDLPENTSTPYVGNPSFEGNSQYDTRVSYTGSSSIEIVSDVNNDRVDDIVILATTIERTTTYTYNSDRGIMEYDRTSLGASKFYVVYGKEGGLGAEVDLDLLSAGEGFVVDAGSGETGSSNQITSAGDVNGDGSSDLLLSDIEGNGLLIYSAAYENLPFLGTPIVSGIPTQGETLSVDLNGLSDGDGIGILLVEWLRNGAVVAEATNQTTYTLSQADVGTVMSVRVSQTDGEGLLEVATSTPTMAVENVNDDAVAVTDYVSGTEDQEFAINVLGNDIDLDGDALTITNVSESTLGTIVINPDQTLLFTPDAEVSGLEMLSYTITDGMGGSSVANIFLAIDDVNDAPIALADTITLVEEGTQTVNVLSNDSDIEGHALSIVSVSAGDKVSVVHLGDGVIEVTGNLDEFGMDSFTYRVEDAEGASSVGTVNVTLTPVNDAPVLVDDAVFAAEDTTEIFDVLANDSDPDGDMLTLISVTNGDHSTATITDNMISVTPALNFFGLDTMTYTVADPSGVERTAILEVTFLPLNDAPTPVDDAVSTDEDVNLTFDPVGNDTDPDGDMLTLVDFDADSDHGRIEMGAGNTLIYDPDSNFNGTDTFTYTVEDPRGETSTATITVTVNPVNDDPRARDDTLSVVQGAMRTFDPRINDSDADGDVMSILSVTDGAGGTTMITQEGLVSYTPNVGFNGTDSFTYVLSDGQGGSEMATVNVSVERNDASVAVDDVYELAEDTSIDVSPLFNDTDFENDSFTLTAFSQTANGTVEDLGDGVLRYTPDADLNGNTLDVVRYTITDEFGRESTADMTFNVTPVNDDMTGALTIQTKYDLFGPSYELDYSALRDKEGIPLLQLAGDGNEVVLSSEDVTALISSDAFLDLWIWRNEAGDVIGGGTTYTASTADVGERLTVEATLTDGDGRETLISVQTGEVDQVYPVVAETGSLGGADTFDTFNTLKTLNPDDPAFVDATGFELGVDDINLVGLERYDALNAFDTAELGSAILTFGDGSILRIEGEGVTPDTLTIDDFVFASGNTGASGMIVLNGTASEGEVLSAMIVEIFDRDGLDSSNFRYQWLRDGTEITSATGLTYQTVAADVGAELTFEVRLTDRFGVEEVVTSAPSAPVVGTAPIAGVTRLGTDDSQVLEGSVGEDVLFGFGGNDTLIGGESNDILNGGDGVDTGVFSGNQATYTVTISPTGTQITDRAVSESFGTDTLNSIELLNFDTHIPLFVNSETNEKVPMNLDVFDGPAGLNAAEMNAIVELYIAYFNRAPDAIGLNYWATEYSNGYTLPEMARSFFVQPETLATYKDVVTSKGVLDYDSTAKVEQFITSVYNNVLGRDPDADGLAYWVNDLQNKPDITAEIFILAIINGAKFPSNPTELTAIDQDYLSTKADLGVYFAVIKGMSDVDDAIDAMSLYTGSDVSLQQTIERIDEHYADALDVESGDFLMQLVGVIDDPFAIA